MKTLISFFGGHLDNAMFASTSEREKDAADHYYALSRGGEVGHHFPVPDEFGGFALYSVVRRLEKDGCVIIRAACVGHFLAEEMEVLDGRS